MRQGKIPEAAIAGLGSMSRSPVNEFNGLCYVRTFKLRVFCINTKNNSILQGQMRTSLAQPTPAVY